MGEIEDIVLGANRKIDEKTVLNPFEAKDTIKIFLAEPSSGQVDVYAHDNRKDLVMELAHLSHHTPFRLFSATTGRMMVTYARDTLAQQALDSGMDWILWVDDDMICPRKMFSALARHMDKADIIVPLCFQRIPPYHPVIYNVAHEIKDGVTYVDTKSRLDYPVNAVFDVDAAGFGVALMRVSILRKIPTPWFFSNTMFGEDLYFCVRAKQCGARIICDSRVKIGHLGPPHVSTELDFLKHNMEKLKEVRKEEWDKVLREQEPVVTSGMPIE